MEGIRVKDESIERMLMWMHLGWIVEDGSGLTQEEIFDDLLISVEIITD